MLNEYLIEIKMLYIIMGASVKMHDNFKQSLMLQHLLKFANHIEEDYP